MSLGNCCRWHFRDPKFNSCLGGGSISSGPFVGNASKVIQHCYKFQNDLLISLVLQEFLSFLFSKLLPSWDNSPYSDWSCTFSSDVILWSITIWPQVLSLQNLSAIKMSRNGNDSDTLIWIHSSCAYTFKEQRCVTCQKTACEDPVGGARVQWQGWEGDREKWKRKHILLCCLRKLNNTFIVG